VEALLGQLQVVVEQREAREQPQRLELEVDVTRALEPRERLQAE
jgi:hypothetical protein